MTSQTIAEKLEAQRQELTAKRAREAREANEKQYAQDLEIANSYLPLLQEKLVVPLSVKVESMGNVVITDGAYDLMVDNGIVYLWGQQACLGVDGPITIWPAWLKVGNIFDLNLEMFAAALERGKWKIPRDEIFNKKGTRWTTIDLEPKTIPELTGHVKIIDSAEKPQRDLRTAKAPEENRAVLNGTRLPEEEVPPISRWFTRRLWGRVWFLFTRWITRKPAMKFLDPNPVSLEDICDTIKGR